MPPIRSAGPATSVSDQTYPQLKRPSGSAAISLSADSGLSNFSDCMKKNAMPPRIAYEAIAYGIAVRAFMSLFGSASYFCSWSSRRYVWRFCRDSQGTWTKSTIPKIQLPISTQIRYRNIAHLLLVYVPGPNSLYSSLETNLTGQGLCGRLKSSVGLRLA